MVTLNDVGAFVPTDELVEKVGNSFCRFVTEGFCFRPLAHVVGAGDDVCDGTDNQAQTSCISKMRDKCSTADLALYCMKMVETRFIRGRTDNPDVNAMARITETFGPNFWRNTIVVLTFANIVEAMKVGWRKLDATAKKRAFQKELQNWEEIIQDVLINEINVPREIATTVLVVPAGHYVDIQLPDRDYWLSMLWFHCPEAIATPEGIG